MAVTKAISGNPVKNDTGTAMGLGNVNPALMNNLTIANNLRKTEVFGSRVTEAVSPASSGNLGTLKAISGGVFSNLEESHYVAMIIGDKIAGLSNTILRSGAGDYGHNNGFTLTPRPKYQRLNITSWNAVTGAATFGGNRGDTITLGPDHAASPTDAVPGELVYMVTGLTPTQDDYKPRTNP